MKYVNNCLGDRLSYIIRYCTIHYEAHGDAIG